MTIVTKVRFPSQYFYGELSKVPWRVYCREVLSRSENTLPKGGEFRPGELKVTYGSNWMEEEDIIPYSIDFYDTWGHYEYWRKMSARLKVPVVVAKLPDAIANEVCLAARAKLSASQLSVGVEIGESRETLATLRHPLVALRNLWSSPCGKTDVATALLECIIHRRNPKRVLRRVGRNVADTWMEIRYGLRPIYYSILDWKNELENKDKRKPFQSRIERVASEKKHTQKVSQDLPANIGSDVFVDGTTVYTSDYKVRYTVLFRRKKPASRLRYYGVHWTQLPSIAWELTGCSFVLDWFVNIGDWIEAHQLIQDIEILAEMLSVRESIRYDTSGVIFWDGPTTHHELPIEGNGTLREAYTRTPPPQWLGSIPNLLVRPKLTLAKALDLGIIVPRKLRG